LGLLLIAVIIKKYISTPLLNLVEVEKIKESADYKIRVLVEGKDEIGVLATGFNDMLKILRNETVLHFYRRNN
jgi:nitrate/nitrite-specific signal transduction histidine kinase